MIEEKHRDGMSTGMILLLIFGGIGCLGLFVVGILASIAIPNFLTFNCRAKQSEAKTNLTGLFTAERAFYGEYDTYTTDLITMNWMPDGSPAYVYGFSQAGPRPTAEILSKIPGLDPARRTTDDPRVLSPAGQVNYQTTRMHSSNGLPLTAQSLPPDTHATKTEFLAGATGDVDNDGILDVWTIDDHRLLINVSDDCHR